jgi:hypothetical protein
MIVYYTEYIAYQIYSNRAHEAQRLTDDAQQHVLIVHLQQRHVQL